MCHDVRMFLEEGKIYKKNMDEDLG